jgi:hypothetical protein
MPALSLVNSDGLMTSTGTSSSSGGASSRAEGKIATAQTRIAACSAMEMTVLRRKT